MCFEGVFDFATSLLSHDLAEAALGAVSGTFGGAYLMFKVQERNIKQKETKKDIAIFNYSLMCLYDLREYLLNLKIQVANPAREELHRNISEYERACIVGGVATIEWRSCISFVHSRIPDFSIKISDFEHYSGSSLVVLYLLKVQRMLNELSFTCDQKNSLIDDLIKQRLHVQSQEDERKYQKKLFGERDSLGNKNTLFIDTISDFSIVIDDTLFFVERSIQCILSVVQQTLSIYDQKKVIKCELLERFKEHMPPDDHIDGYED